MTGNLVVLSLGVLLVLVLFAGIGYLICVCLWLVFRKLLGDEWGPIVTLLAMVFLLIMLAVYDSGLAEVVR